MFLFAALFFVRNIITNRKNLFVNRFTARFPNVNMFNIADHKYAYNPKGLNMETTPKQRDISKVNRMSRMIFAYERLVRLFLLIHKINR